MRFVLRITTMLAVGALSAAAQTPVDPASRALRGVVATVSGAPIPGATIFLLASLESTQSDTAGKFAMRTTAVGSVTLVARRIGFAPATIVVPVDATSPLTLTLVSQAPFLEPIRVQAGAYTAG